MTFGTWKPGLLIDPGAQHAGAVELVDIGLAPDLPTASITALQAADVHALLPAPSPESDKYRRGVLGIVAGSDTYTGAALLATGGALRAGAGMVRFVSVAHPAELVRARWPEAVVTVLNGEPDDDVLGAGRVQAWVVGPGIGTDAYAEHLVAQVLRSDVPVIVDADALTDRRARSRSGRGPNGADDPHAARRRTHPPARPRCRRAQCDRGAAPALRAAGRATAAGDRVAEGLDDGDLRTRRADSRQPDRHAIVGDRGQWRRPVGYRRRAARRWAERVRRCVVRGLPARRRRPASRPIGAPIVAEDIIANLAAAIGRWPTRPG